MMKSIITKEHLIITLKNVQDFRKSGNVRAVYRAAGFLEGVLYSLDKLNPKGDFPYRDIEYTEIGWFGKEKVKTRQQTYVEYMIERIEELIEEIDK